MILGIDPGTTESGWVVLDGAQTVHRSGTDQNRVVLNLVNQWAKNGKGPLAIEMIASYGMAVGKEVFETCVWIGRFVQAYEWWTSLEPTRIYRRDVKLHLCGNAKAKDANIRQALIDRYPPEQGGGKTPQIGTKAQPGPLYGVTGDAWAALAVAVTARDMEIANA